MQVPMPHIENVVATFYLGTASRIDLKILPSFVPVAHFGPNFAAAMMSLLEPKTTCLVFASGKAVCTGAKSKEAAILACNRYVEMLVMFGVPVSFRNFQAHNVVYQAECPFKVDLRALADSDTEYTSYEKAVFPGLTHKVMIPGETNAITFLVFVSGLCVITGGVDEDKMMAAWKHFYTQDLVRFKVGVNYGSSGNYRMSQNICVDAEKDWMHQQMVSTMRPSCQLPWDDENVLRLALTPEMNFIMQIIAEIADLKPHIDEPGPFIYKPFGMPDFSEFIAA